MITHPSHPSHPHSSRLHRGRCHLYCIFVRLSPSQTPISPYLASTLFSTPQCNPISLLISPLSYTLPDPCPILAKQAFLLKQYRSHPYAFPGQHANQKKEKARSTISRSQTLGVDQEAKSSNSIPAILPQHTVSTSLVDLHLCKRGLASDGWHGSRAICQVCAHHTCGRLRASYLRERKGTGEEAFFFRMWGRTSSAMRRICHTVLPACTRE